MTPCFFLSVPSTPCALSSHHPGLASLETLDLPALATVLDSGLTAIDLPSLVSLTLPALTSADFILIDNVDASGNPIAFPSLVSVAGDLSLQACAARDPHTTAPARPNVAVPS